MSDVELDEHTEQVYRLMLAHQEWGVAEIAAELRIGQDDVRHDLDRLAELNLLRCSQESPGELRPVSLDVGLRLLLQRQQEELLRHQQRLAERQTMLSNLLAEYTDVRCGAGRHDVECLNGVDAVHLRLEELVRRTRAETLSFLPGGAQSAASLTASRPLDQDLRSRGVAVLTLCQDSVRNDPATLGYARWLTELGGEVRTAPTLPLRMVMFDREVALLPMDPDDTRKGAVQLASPGVIRALVALFEQVWASAAELCAERDRERDAAGLTGQERELLRLLARGHTDEGAARQLGIGLRTAGRMMSELMSRLGARSRFEAGIRAAARGWLD